MATASGDADLCAIVVFCRSPETCKEEIMKYRWFVSACLLGLCLFIPSKSFGQSTVSCNSDDEKRHYCAVDTSGGVRVQNQRSGSPCTEGYSWGYDDQGVWGDHGCPPHFLVGAPRGYPDSHIANPQYRTT